jgi:hypothetical protein
MTVETQTRIYRNTKKQSYQPWLGMQEALIIMRKNRRKRIHIKGLVWESRLRKLKKDVNVKKHIVLKSIANAITPRLFVESFVDVRVVSILRNMKISLITKCESK